MLPTSSGWTSFSPAIFSTQMTPSWLALWASQGGAGDVADGVEAGLAGAAVLVDDDVGAVDLHPGAFEAEVLDVADDADGGDHAVDGDLLRLAAGLDRRR